MHKITIYKCTDRKIIKRKNFFIILLWTCGSTHDTIDFIGQNSPTRSPAGDSFAVECVGRKKKNLFIINELQKRGKKVKIEIVLI